MRKSELAQEVARLRASRRGYREKLREARQELHQLRRAAPPAEYRGLKRKWAVRVEQPMLLISQVQRSGGTLLARLFDGHPECFAHPMELKWGRPAKWNWPSFEADATLTAREAFDLLEELWVRKMIQQAGYSKYPQWEAGNKPRHRPKYPFAFDRGLQYEIFAAAFNVRRPGSRRDVLNAYMTALFNAWIDFQNLYSTPKRWITCFIAGLIRQPDSLDRYFSDYPDGRLVTLIRHPAAWFASASRHTFSTDPVDAVQHWHESTQASVAAHERYGDRVMIVTFEDLVLRTDATMRAICRWMGLTFHDSLLQPTYNSMPVLSDSSFRLSTGIDPEAAHRHLAAVTTEQTSAIGEPALRQYAEVEARFRIEA
jgi:hypothetical protein